MEIHEVDGFEPNAEFSDYWDEVIFQRAHYWGLAPDNSIHSFPHLHDVYECLQARDDIIVFEAELEVPKEWDFNEVALPEVT